MLFGILLPRDFPDVERAGRRLGLPHVGGDEGGRSEVLRCGFWPETMWFLRSRCEGLLACVTAVRV